ncbi:MAG: hypothetical protein L3J71_01735 [Victivallaceae bacterium]|nr:hypothetical protein [Victivallaceae bacterium]
MNIENNSKAGWLARTIKGGYVRTAVVLLIGLAFYWTVIRLPRPPADNIVATYRGGNVTTEELRVYIHDFIACCSKHTSCSRHGENHEECSSS